MQAQTRERQVRDRHVGDAENTLLNSASADLHCSTHMHMPVMGSQVLLQQSPLWVQLLPASKQREAGG